MSAETIPTAGTVFQTPWVRLRSAAAHTFIYEKMVDHASPDARPGDCVTVYDRNDRLFGHGLYNPNSRIALRMLNNDERPIDEAFWRWAIERAVSLRTRVLRLDATTEAYRVVHAEGDEISGLIVDRYGDALSIEVFSLGIWRALPTILPILRELTGTKHHRVHVDDLVQKQEGFTATPMPSEGLPNTVRITENGVRFRVKFDVGHKTGFFCDQRENRKRLAAMTHEADVLDLCCYTGGFGLYARTIGGAAEVTCVDLDEHAIEATRDNANLNQARITAVKADIFTYMRQMQGNRRTFDVVVLDPPKLVFGRADDGDGRYKYSDMNRLAATLVKPGGLMLTCSCSGAVSRDEFVGIVTSAIRHVGRQCQILDVCGASPDHPVSPRCPESAYLKAAWLRVL